MFSLPRSCWGCQRLLAAPDLYFCPKCAIGIEPLDPGDLQAQNILPLYRYARPLSQLLCDLKYRGRMAAARPLGALMWSAPANPWRHLTNQALALPVPLHPLRRLRRGFNQSDAILRWCLRVAQKETRSCIPRIGARKLRRIRATPPQKGLGRNTRLANVERVFDLRAMKGVPKNSPIFVVDDVCTTGATLRDCLRALREAGYHNCRGLALLWADSTDADA